MPDSGPNPSQETTRGTRRDTARVRESESRRSTGKHAVEAPSRIVVFSPKLNLDGTTLYTKVLLRALREMDHRVVLVAESGPMAETLAGTYDDWFEVDEGGRLGFFGWRRLKDRLLDFEPEVLHTVTPDPALPAVKAADTLARPLVVSVHGIKPHELPDTGDKRYDGYISSDHSVRERLLNDCRLDRDRTTLIPDAAFPETPPDEKAILADRKRPVVGWVSPLVEGCGYHCFIEAAMKVQAHGVDVMFSILGSGPSGPEVRDTVEERGMLQRIVVVQSLYDYGRIWAPFDVAVVDTRQTGSAMMVLHAMANGRPVIATEGGAVFDLIQDGVDGLIVPRDDPDALSERILMLVQNPPERLRMARAAFEKVEEHYRPAEMAQALSSVYAAMRTNEPLPKSFESQGGRRSARSHAG